MIQRAPVRYFFVGMALLAILVVLLAFVPEYRKYAGGTFPIAAILHVHAAIMVGWVAAFLLQAYLGATGHVRHHRRLGRYAIALGWLAWASMIVVEFRTYAIYPPPRTTHDVNWDLPGPHVYLTFAIFLAWAIRERARPAWHKRLMTFALFLSLGAAIERFLWIPMDFGFVPFAALLDFLLLAPMAIYDIVTPGPRLHPATIGGAIVLFASQALLLALWGTTLWTRFAHTIIGLVHSA